MTQDALQLQGSVLRFLSIRPRSRQEILTYLSQKTSDANQVNLLIEKLERLKLIDDQAFAQWYIDSRSRTRPRSAKLIASELKRKGVTADQLLPAADESMLAQSALAKKIKTWTQLPWIDFKHKAFRFLASRGFSWSVIEATTKKVYNNLHVK